MRNYGVWFGLPYAITYFYNVYGPRERSDSFGTLIAIFKEQYQKGEPLTVVSPGTQRRNFTHVSDIVDGLIRVGWEGEGDEYGIGSPDPYSVLDVAHMFGSEVMMLPERKGNRQESSIDTAKTQALGWRARMKLPDHIREFIASAAAARTPAGKRILVFSTSFHPVAGPAEEALCDLMRAMPDVHFDIIAAALLPAARGAACSAPNGTIHRVGRGRRIDKYLLPLLGYRVGRKLCAEHRYLFAWSLMASYAALAALLVRRTEKLPLLVTLADQRIDAMPRLKRSILRFIVRRADQAYASTEAQTEDLSRMLSRARAGRSAYGAGSALMGQIRFAYQGYVTARLRQ